MSEEAIEDVPVGTRVRVIDRLHGHDFSIGKVVVRTDEEDADRFDSLDGSDSWYLGPSEYEIVE